MGRFERILMALLCLTGAACTADTEEGSIEEQAATEELRAKATDILQIMGFDVSTLIFEGDDKVVVEGDMVMSLQAILDEGSKDVEKGFWYRLWGDRAPATDAILNFAPELPTVWRTAFRAAAVEWSRIDGIDIAEGAGTSFLNVNFRPLASSGTFAEGAYPPWALGISGYVTVNSTYSGTCFTGADAAARRQKTAMHEIGHTLGFAHPAEGIFIAGTSSTAATVMAQGCVARTALTSDDVASANIKY